MNQRKGEESTSRASPCWGRHKGRSADAAGAPETLRALLAVAALAGVIVLPALAYLFRLTQSEDWTRH